MVTLKGALAPLRAINWKGGIARILIIYAICGVAYVGYHASETLRSASIVCTPDENTGNAVAEYLHIPYTPPPPQTPAQFAKCKQGFVVNEVGSRVLWVIGIPAGLAALGVAALLLWSLLRWIGRGFSAPA